ncbi:MAG: recombinase family protein [Candidatus Gracilibacteria bacterium]
MISKEIPIKVFAYIRESTRGQFSNGYGVEDQKVEIQAYCEENNFLVGEDWFSDAKSGGTARKRVGWTRMIDEAHKRDDVRFIVVHEASRFFREFVKTLQFEQALEGENIYVIDPSVDYDPRSYLGSDGKIDPDRWHSRMQARLSAELERRKDSHRATGRGLRKRNAGFAIGQLPYGLRVCNGPTRKYVEYNPEEAEIVKEVYKIYLETSKGYTAIARLLNSRGLFRNTAYQDDDKENDAFRTFYRKELFTDEVVREILTNQAHIGHQNYPPFAPLLTLVNGDKQHLKPLISQHDFDLAKSIRKNNRRGKSAKVTETSKQRRTYMLQGKIFSAVNGATMHGFPETRKDGTIVRRYVAKTNKRGDEKHIPSIRCDEVENRVIQMFKNLKLNSLETIEQAVRNLINADVKMRASSELYNRGRQNDQQKIDVRKAIEGLKAVLKFDDSFATRKTLAELEEKRHELEKASYANFVDYYDFSDLKMFLANVVHSIERIQDLVAKKDLVDVMFSAVYSYVIPKTPAEIGLETVEAMEVTLSEAKELKDLLQENCPRILEKVLGAKHEDEVKVWIEPSGLYILLADPNIADYTNPGSEMLGKVVRAAEPKKKTVLSC